MHLLKYRAIILAILRGDKNEWRKAKLIKDLNSAGIDINFIIQESFLGYKYRKKVNKLYEEKAETPTKLIKMYYSLAPGKVEFDKMKKHLLQNTLITKVNLRNTQ